MNIDVGLITVILFLAVFFVFAAGLPVAFSLGSVAMIFTVFLWGPSYLYMAVISTFGQTQSLTFIAIPLFILMGMIMRSSGVADAMFDCIYKWSGRLRGGLAMGTVVICAIFAAMCGVSGAATVAMANIALPSMLKHGYSKHIATGTVAASGLLSLLIPPSVLMIIYGAVTGESVGRMYLAALTPGVLLAGIYIIYIGVRSYLQPDLCPGIPKDKIPTWREKFVAVKDIVVPLLMVGAVLGGIYTGFCTPTEAAAVGVAGAIISASIYHNLTWQVIKESTIQTFEISSMVMWIIMAVGALTSIHSALGAQELGVRMASMLPGGRWSVIIAMQLSLFILGCLMDDFAIILIFAPIYVPTIKLLGFNPLWFAILFMINMQMAWLTPPYGFNLFYMRSAVPKGITMADIIRGVIPFIGCQMICLILVMIFPQISLWLPDLVFKR